MELLEHRRIVWNRIVRITDSVAGVRFRHCLTKTVRIQRNKVRNNLERIGGFTKIPMEPIVGMDEPYHYRNKAQFPVGTDKEGHIVTGFYAGRTHTIIPNRDCALGLPVNREILDIVIDFMENIIFPHTMRKPEKDWCAMY